MRLNNLFTNEMSSSAQSSAIVSRFFTTCTELLSQSAVFFHLLVSFCAEEKNCNVVKFGDQAAEDHICHLEDKKRN